MAAAGGFSRTAADRALNAALDSIRAELIGGGRVKVSGFGSFRVVTRQARIGRDPRTGAAMPIPACKTVSFILSQELKGALNPPLSRAATMK